MSAGAVDGREGGLARHAAGLAALFVALLAWTWGTWPDPLVDFGRELYVPWRLSEGARLHADLAWFNGPLSPHWNEWMFRAFGVGLATLVWVNVALFALVLALLHYVLRRISTVSAATVACALVMLLCGFGQLVGIGNYNFVCPYSHEATHGVLLGLAALAAVQRWREVSRERFVVASGLCVGLAFLTKPEMFVAALAGAGAALAMHAWSARRPIARSSALFAVGLAAPIAAAWLLQIGSLGAAEAWRATLGAWPQLAGSDVAQLEFYRAGMGLDAPAHNLLAMLAWAAGIAALFFAIAAVSASSGERRRAAGFAIVAVLGGAAFPLLHLADPRLWQFAARPWPLFALAALAMGIVAARRDRASSVWPGVIGFAAFALAMLAKMALNARLVNYGFALALPSTALVAVALWSWLPSHFRRPRTIRVGVAFALAGFAAVHLARTHSFLSRKNVELGSGADAFRTDARGHYVAQALDWLERGFQGDIPDPYLAVFPEGVSINYLARLENPTPYVNFMPPELVLFGEPAIVDAFREHPPMVVMLTHKSTAEYGFPWFGRDYGQQLFAWLRENYRPVELFGDPPLGLLLPGETPPAQPVGFGIRVFVRAP
jgi:hypothetical protein